MTRQLKTPLNVHGNLNQVSLRAFSQYQDRYSKFSGVCNRPTSWNYRGKINLDQSEAGF